MRLFFGLELDRDTALNMADWRDRQIPGAGRAVPPANFHITLAFLGEIPERKLDRLLGEVEQRQGDGLLPGGTLQLDDSGYWPRPEIFWIGPRQWPDNLAALASNLRHLGSSLGSKRDRNRFHPHVTLYRRCPRPPPAPAQAPDFTLQYDHFTLFESRQGRRGVTYHPLADWGLC